MINGLWNRALNLKNYWINKENLSINIFGHTLHMLRREIYQEVFAKQK